MAAVQVPQGAVAQGETRIAGPYTRVRSEIVLPLVWGLFLGRAALLGDVSPFGVVFVAAVRRSRPESALWAGLGVFLGMVSRDPLRAPGLFALVAGTLLAAGAWESAPETVRHLFPLLVGCFAALVPLAPVGALPSSTMPEILDGVLGLGLAVAYHDGIPFALPRTEAAERPGDPTGFLVLLASALSATAPLEVAGLPVGLFLAPLAGLAAARVGGAGLGAVAALAVGSVFNLAGGLPLPLVAMTAAAAMLAGWARRYGVPAAVIAAIGGALAFARAVSSLELLLGALALFAAALIVAWAPPMALWEYAWTWLGLGPARPDRALRRRLREMSSVLHMLSAAVDEQAVATVPLVQRQALATPDRIVTGVTERVCDGCARYNECWDRDVYRTYRRLQEGLERFGPPGDQDDLTRNLESWCVRPRQVAIALGYVYDLSEMEARLVRRWRATRSALAEPLRTVSELLERVEREGDVLTPTALRWTCGIATRPHTRGPGAVSGDAYAVRHLPGDRLLVGLSDGMGSGVAAAVESEPTISLAERMLAAGFGIRPAAQTVNSLMLLEGSEDTFATLDLTLVHLNDGEAEFVKVGAPPTLLVRKGRPERVEGHTPPSGILRDVQVDVRRRRVAAGDWLISLTDGAFDCLADEEDWLDGFLRSLDQARGPQWVADQLLERARRHELTDDATVVVVRLEAVNRAL